MSGTRGATAVDVRIAGVLIWLRRGLQGRQGEGEDSAEASHYLPGAPAWEYIKRSRTLTHASAKLFVTFHNFSIYST